MLSFQFNDCKNVALAQPLKTYITENYQPDPTETTAIQHAADELEQFRFKYYAALRSGETTITIKQAFLSYIQRLKPVGVRFPFGQNANSGILGSWFSGDAAAASSKRLISIEFSYQDQFDSKKWVSSYSINFEIAKCIMNYANRLTRDALELYDPNNDASINDTCQLYKEAAALYDFLSKQSDITVLGTVSPDLSFDALSFFSLTCLAQAQALFPQKAMLKKSSASIIASLSAGTAKSYEDAIAAANTNPSTKTYLSTARQINWLDFLEFQRLYWSATANLWYGKVQFDTAKYGDELAYLFCARSACVDATRLAAEVQKISPKAVELRNTLQATIAARLAQAEKDNNSIYFSKIPSEVPLVPAKVMATLASDVVQAYFDASNDPFSMLVDSAVRDLIGTVTKELEGMVNSIAAGCEGVSEEARRELHSMNLPGALEAVDNGHAGQGNNNNPGALVPDDLWNKLQAILTMGGLEHLDRLIDRTKQGSNYVSNKIVELRTLLNKEAEEDNKLRTQYGAQKWSRQSSTDLIKPMIAACDNIDKLCADAARADAICATDLTTLKTELGPIIRLDRQSLGNTLPRPAQNAQSLANQPFVVDLRKLVQELSALIAERETSIRTTRGLLVELLNKLRLQIGSTPNRDKFIADLKEALHQQLLPLHGENQIPKQKDLLQRISIANRTFNMGLQSQGSNDVNAQQRQAAIQKYYVAVNNYNRVRGHLEEGSKFYQDLTTDTVGPLEQRAKDYAMAREIEKKMWVDDLNNSFKNMSIQPQQQSQPTNTYQQSSYNQNYNQTQAHPPQYNYQQNGYNQYNQQQQQPSTQQQYGQQPYGYGNQSGYGQSNNGYGNQSGYGYR